MVRRKPTVREHKTVKSFAATGSYRETGMMIVDRDKAIDNDSGIVSRILRRGNVREMLREELIRNGLDLSEFAKKIIRQTDATKTHVATYLGRIEDTLETPDNQARNSALQLAANIFGATKDDGSKYRDHQLDELLDSLDPDDLERLLIAVASSSEAEYEDID